MRSLVLCSLVAVVLALLGTWVLAQELVPTPDPVGGAKSPAGPATSAGATARPNANPEQWRYRWFNGRWWYWTPQNRWMWYGDDGRWVQFDPTQPPAPAVQGGEAPAVYYSYPAPGYYYSPGPAYWAGYYPGVAVGVGPYGSVGVGVGRRIGVDVWGPHGGVRVGRIQVGW
jgi:hypothetical protein